MKSNKYLSVVSLAVLGLCCTRSAFAQLKATAFPGTFQDVPFSQRVQTKAAGYEPYKDMKAYVIPEFKKTDQKFKDEMCERDREECCRRWPDYKNDTFSCLPQIIYEMYGGSRDNCKGTAPESYYTPKGATITCVPERKRSKFLGWCKDAGLTDCDMMQTIAPGEKDDKFFWAKWECIDTSYIMTQTSCDCPDVNMDDNCRCTGRGMSPTPNTDGKCECVSLNAHVQDGECVCDNDPSYDPTTDCTEPLQDPEPEECPDEPHQDPTDNCACYAPTAQPDPTDDNKCKCFDETGVIDPNQQIVVTGMTQTCECKDTTLMEIDSVSGRCKCKDTSLDINTNPNCDSVNVGFRFWYCRANPKNASKLLAKRASGNTAEFGTRYCKTQISDLGCISGPGATPEGIINQIFKTSTGQTIALRDGMQMYDPVACPTFNNLSCLNFNIPQPTVDKFILDLINQISTVKDKCVESNRKWYLLIDKFEVSDYIPYKTICIGGQCVAGTIINY